MLNASCGLQAAKDRSDQLQQQLVRTDTDLLESKVQCLKLQKDLSAKCEEVTAEKQEQAALQRAHRASQKASIHCTQTFCYPHTPLPSPPPPTQPGSYDVEQLRMICGLLWRSWHVTPSLSHGTMILQRFCVLLLHAYLYVT